MDKPKVQTLKYGPITPEELDTMTTSNIINQSYVMCIEACQTEVERENWRNKWVVASMISVESTKELYSKYVPEHILESILQPPFVDIYTMKVVVVTLEDLKIPEEVTVH